MPFGLGYSEVLTNRIERSHVIQVLVDMFLERLGSANLVMGLQRISAGALRQMQAVAAVRPNPMKIKILPNGKLGQ